MYGPYSTVSLPRLEPWIYPRCEVSTQNLTLFSMHIEEAARVLEFTEEEFMKALDWQNE